MAYDMLIMAILNAELYYIYGYDGYSKYEL